MGIQEREAAGELEEEWELVPEPVPGSPSEVKPAE